MRRTSIGVISALAVALCDGRPSFAQSAPVGLTGAPALAKAYDSILDARFERAEAELGVACQTAPREACDVLDVAAMWWTIQLEPESLALDAEFSRRVETAIASAEDWAAREPSRAEAWFYLGAAYGSRVQWRVLRNEKLLAARDGKRIKEALEHALALDPDLEDAHFGIGLYRYYADVAPAAAKVLRWILFLPGGDRKKGLLEILRAHERGELLRGEASYQLHLLYLWYEQQPARALDLLESLRARYPHNPLFLQRIGEVQDVYLHDHPASLKTFRTLLQAARDERVAAPEVAEVRARMGTAEQLDALFETDLAIDHLRAVVDARPEAPHGALARSELQLAAAYDRLGERELALTNYRAALDDAVRDDASGTRERAVAAMKRRPNARTAEAYRLSLEGWRALERGRVEEARSSLTRSLALKPDDPVTRFRYAKLRARSDAAGALAEYEAIIRSRPPIPPTILASSCLEAARLFERSGQRDRAVERYRDTIRIAGSEPHTREAAAQALARLHARSSTQSAR
jgi:tetratricopeptide (TPR) repeat protein